MSIEQTEEHLSFHTINRLLMEASNALCNDDDPRLANRLALRYVEAAMTEASHHLTKDALQNIQSHSC